MRNAGGVGDGVERCTLFGSAQDDIHDGRRLVGERYGARLHLELGDCTGACGRICGSCVVARQYADRANCHNARHAPWLSGAFVHVIRHTRILEHEPIGNRGAQGFVVTQNAVHRRQRFEHAILSWADAGKRKSFHGQS